MPTEDNDEIYIYLIIQLVMRHVREPAQAGARVFHLDFLLSNVIVGDPFPGR